MLSWLLFLKSECVLQTETQYLLQGKNVEIEICEINSIMSDFHSSRASINANYIFTKMGTARKKGQAREGRISMQNAILLSIKFNLPN